MFDTAIKLKLIISVGIISVTFRKEINPKQNSAKSVMRLYIQQEMLEGQLTKFTVSIFMMGGNGFDVELGSVTSL